MGFFNLKKNKPTSTKHGSTSDTAESKIASAKSDEKLGVNKIFGKGGQIDKKQNVEVSKTESVRAKVTTANQETSLLLGPRITEKATDASLNDNVYVFNVSARATKVEIKKAVKNLYNVVPVKVNIVNSKNKKVFFKGKTGVKSQGKKAYIYLKQWEKIESV
jgi:large subunit ribosomal protein L23